MTTEIMITAKKEYEAEIISNVKEVLCNFPIEDIIRNLITLNHELKRFTLNSSVSLPREHWNRLDRCLNILHNFGLK